MKTSTLHLWWFLPMTNILYLSYLGLRSKGQSLAHHEGHSFDILSTVDQEEIEKDIYFNIDIPLKSLSNTFSGDTGATKKKNKNKKRKKEQ